VPVGPGVAEGEEDGPAVGAPVTPVGAGPDAPGGRESPQAVSAATAMMIKKTVRDRVRRIRIGEQLSAGSAGCQSRLRSWMIRTAGTTQIIQDRSAE